MPILDRLIHRMISTDDPQVFRERMAGKEHVADKTIFEPATQRVIIDNKSRRVHGYVVGLDVYGVAEYKQFVAVVPDKNMKVQDIEKMRILVALVTLFDLHTALGVSIDPKFFSAPLVDAIVGFKEGGIPSAPLPESLTVAPRRRSRRR